MLDVRLPNPSTPALATCSITFSTPAKKRKMRYSEVHNIASTARSKLNLEADQKEYRLRYLVGHASRCSNPFFDELTLTHARPSRRSRGRIIGAPIRGNLLIVLKCSIGAERVMLSACIMMVCVRDFRYPGCVFQAWSSYVCSRAVLLSFDITHRRCRILESRCARNAVSRRFRHHAHEMSTI